MNLQSWFAGILSALTGAAAESTPQRTLVLGDIHGCFDEMLGFLSELSYDADKDKLIFVGDLVNKGPKSIDVIRWVRKHPAYATGGIQLVTGNHEIKVLKGKKPEPWTSELKKGDLKFLQSLPTYLRLPKAYQAPSGELRDVLVVHAGLLPDTPVEKQSTQTLTEIRTIRKLPNGQLEASKTHDYTPWTDYWKGPEFVVYGHDAKVGEVGKANSHGIDGGCVYGRGLFALELPSGKVHKYAKCRSYVDCDDDVKEEKNITRA